MIVNMRTCEQAAPVAAASGGVHLPGKPATDGTPRLSRVVALGGDFETHRAAVESVSVLFELYSPVVAQSGPRPHRHPGHPVPAELP